MGAPRWNWIPPSCKPELRTGPQAPILSSLRVRVLPPSSTPLRLTGRSASSLLTSLSSFRVRLRHAFPSSSFVLSQAAPDSGFVFPPPSRAEPES
eukprot:3160031-Rhodomonas_salina.1